MYKHSNIKDRYYTFRNAFGVFNVKMGTIRECKERLSPYCSGKYIKTNRGQTMCLLCLRFKQGYGII